MTEKAAGIALVLSGGGFRATLFHLGVIRYLAHTGQLEHVTHICSVSGGSILAAHLVLNWEHYTAQGFDTAVRPLLRFIRLDVRGRILRHWIAVNALVGPLVSRLLRRFRLVRVLPDDFGGFGMLTQLLQKHYHRLLDGRTLVDLARPTPSGAPRPDLHILAVSLSTGSLAAFSQNGVWIDEKPVPREISTERLPVALAVAASSAFPPLFPPIRVDSKLLLVSRYEFPHTHYLADGGVYDNLGIHRLKRLGIPAFRRVIVSDAGARSDWVTEDSFTSPIPRNIRATDLLMSRVTALDHESLTQGFLPNVTVVSLHDTVGRVDDPAALPVDTQRSLATVRTDLDHFSDREIYLLEMHGYTIARHRLGLGVGPQPGAGPVAAEVAEDGVADWTEYADRRSSVNRERDEPLRDSFRVRPHLFSARDLSSWVTLVLCIGWLWLLHYVVLDPLLGKRRFQQYDLARTVGGELRRAKTAERAGDVLARLEVRFPWPADWAWSSVLLEPLVESREVRTQKKATRASIEDWSTHGRRPDDFDRRILEMARAYGRSWRQEATYDAQKLFAESRELLFRRASEVTTSIAFYSNLGAWSSVAEDIEAFWALYWGDLPLVEGDDVTAAMVAFGKLLPKEQGSRIATTASLLQGAAKLTAATDKELGIARDNSGSLRSFSFSYDGRDAYKTARPGRRIWLLVREGLWTELLPDGAYQFLPVVRREVQAGCPGTLVYRVPDPKVEFFVPDRGCAPAFLLYRHSEVDRGKWVRVAPLEDPL